MKVVLLVLLFSFVFFQVVLSKDENVYNGELAEPKQFPFLVSLYNTVFEYNFCGGSLIDPYHVLTAGHCTNGQIVSQISVQGGSLDSGDLTQGELIPVEEIYQHPRFKATEDNIINDVSVLKLSRPFSQNIPNIRSVKLARYDLSPGDRITMAGWGKKEDQTYPDELYWATATVLSNADCTSVPGYEAVQEQKQICLSVAEGTDTCQGDSGGPIFTGDHRNAVQYGLVSWGYGCAVKPGVYTRVSYFREWIKKKTTYDVYTECETNDCVDVSNSADYLGLCDSIGGVFLAAGSDFGSALFCTELNFQKTSKVKYSWSDCSNKEMKDLCSKVGKFKCSNGVAKCTRL
jgi:trypsin